MITSDVQIVIEILKRNEVVAIPTETVYGLAGNAFNDAALERIYSLKNRPRYNPLIVHIGSIEQLNHVAVDIPEKAEILVRHFWPGPLTLVLKKHPRISEWVTSGKDTVAVRMPNHPLALEVLSKLDFPLAAPSANPFGMISPTSAAHVEGFFRDKSLVILDGGECQKGVESTIIGFENDEPVLYRTGSIPIEEIQEVIGNIRTNHGNHEIKAPGMLSSHYAPKTITYLCEENLNEFISRFSGKKIGLLLFKSKDLDFDATAIEILSPNGDLDESARNLYSAMHRLDSKNLDLIIAEKLPDYGLGVAINDRLLRASHRDHYDKN